MKNIILTGLLLATCTGINLAQDAILPEVKGFRKISRYPVYYPENLWNYINGAADAYLAMGFIDLNITEYKKGKNVIRVEIYRHGDHSMAFGIYASERSPSYRFMKIGSQGYIEDGAINFFKGNYYVKIRTWSEKAKILQAEESLALRVADILRGDSEMPSSLSDFPDEGIEKNSETYINDAVLGHKFLKKAFRAVYSSGNEKFSVFLIKCSSLSETLETVSAYLRAPGIEPELSETGKYVFADGYNGTIFLAWKNERIVIISGLEKDQSEIADKYTSQILREG